MKGVIALAVLVILVGVTTAKKGRASRLPIRDDAQHEDQQDGGHKKASECRFGDRQYELEETWNPDLGAPFGVMYCVHCECVPIHKKRRIVGRVRCKNIKTECPKPTCGDPILLPGRCCKVCPGQDDNPDLKIDVDLKREEEEKNGRHYASLLTSPDHSGTAATGRFYFRKKTLSYSFVTSQDFGEPQLLTFLDEEGNIIEEFPLSSSPFQNYTGKVCGSWNRVPRRYRKQLRRDEIFAQLTSRTRVINGRVGKHYGLSSELFSSLMVSNQDSVSAAATAIVSVSSSTGSVHTMLLAAPKLFGPEDSEDVAVEVSFDVTTDGETRSIKENLRIPNVRLDTISIDFKTVFDEPELLALGEGRLRISMQSKSAPERSVSGFLVPKFSCDFFDAVLSPLNIEEEMRPDTNAKGLAWMVMDKEAQIHYHVKMVDLSSDLVSIHIDNGKRSRRLLKVVGELSASGSASESWANGSLILGAADIEDLYRADLFVHVQTVRNEKELRGRLVPQLKGDAHDTAAPILLSGENSRVSGIAWANIDSSCTLNYQVRLAGVERKTDCRIELEDYPIQNLKTLPLFPGKRSTLQDFRGPEVEGHLDSIHKLTMARMDSGDAALVVSHTGEEPFHVDGKLTGVQPPSDCLPRFARNELELMPGYLSDLGEEQPGSADLPAKCLYEGSIHEDGAQWAAKHKPCTMCSCQRGKIVCDPIVCPSTSCDNPIILEGACCPTCEGDSQTDGTRGCLFAGDNKFHAAGSKWHPYLPPFGFTRCAVCSCQADSLKVECSRKQCPSLPCPEDQQIRADELSCCKTCKELPESEASASIDRSQLHDMGVARTTEDVLNEGGCDFRGEVYPNGAAWHPRVLPFGEMKCVTCKCKDGRSACKKKECQALTCKYKLQDKHACCPRCAETKEEIKRSRKIRRLLKLRKLRRQKKLQQKMEAED